MGLCHITKDGWGKVFDFIVKEDLWGVEVEVVG